MTEPDKQHALWILTPKCFQEIYQNVRQQSLFSSTLPLATFFILYLFYFLNFSFDLFSGILAWTFTWEADFLLFLLFIFFMILWTL